MSILENLQLPNLEKIKIIEMLGGDLTPQEDDIPVPSWHESELRKMEADYQSGQISSVPWDDAKKTLRTRFK